MNFNEILKAVLAVLPPSSVVLFIIVLILFWFLDKKEKMVKQLSSELNQNSRMLEKLADLVHVFIYGRPTE